MPMSPQLLAARKLDTAATTARITGLVLAGLLLIPTVSAFAHASLVEVIGYFLNLFLAYIGPAIAYLFLASRIKAARRWAVITLIVLASLHLLLALLAAVAATLIGGIGIALIATVLALLLILLIVHASQCFAALNHLAGPRGFELFPSAPPAPHSIPPPARPIAGASDWPDIR